MAERETAVAAVASRATPSTRSRRLLRPETTAMPSSCSRERPRVVDATPSSRSKASRSTTQEDEPEPIKPEPKKSRKRKKREDQPPPRRKFRVKALEADRPSSTSNARVDVTTAGLRVGADRPRDIPNAPAAPAPAPAPPPVVLDEEAFRSSTRLDRAACPEWFCGDSSKTPAAFLAAKAWMVSLSKRSAPDQFLTATICRQRLSVDAAAALRLPFR